MKRRYERPSAYIEEFTPNEYVAACGESGTTYQFECNAGGGVHGAVFQETNGQPGLQIGGNDEDTRITTGWESYHACGATHEASVKDKFIENCYYIPKSARIKDKHGIRWDTSKAINVIVWRGPTGKNVHCTTKLNMKEWATAKS